MSGYDESSFVFPDNLCPQPDGELLCRSPNKLTATEGFMSLFLYCIILTLLSGETGRYDLAWKDLCSVLDALNA